MSQLSSSHFPAVSSNPTVSLLELMPIPCLSALVEEPMQLDQARLTHSESQRNFSIRVCLYFEQPGHFNKGCSVRPKGLCSLGHPEGLVSRLLHVRHPLTSQSLVHSSGFRTPSVSFLIDSGADDSFIWMWPSKPTSRWRPYLSERSSWV